MEINLNLIRATSTVHTLGFTSQFHKASLKRPYIIQRCDALSLSLWENTDSGLWAGQTAKPEKLDALKVDKDGFIFVPHVSRIKLLAIIQTQYAKSLQSDCKTTLLTHLTHRYKYQDQLETDTQCP